jgi:hypothetical protein
MVAPVRWQFSQKTLSFTAAHEGRPWQAGRGQTEGRAGRSRTTDRVADRTFTRFE